jgi:hypothetical protein
LGYKYLLICDLSEEDTTQVIISQTRNMVDIPKQGELADGQKP